jgi:hypothetical protein
MVAGLLLVLQIVAQSSAPASGEYQFGYVMGVLIGGLLVMLLFGHLSGKLAQSVGGNYWLFAIIGFFFGILGIIAAVIYYAYVKAVSRPPADVRKQGYYTPPGYPRQSMPYQQPGYQQLTPLPPQGQPQMLQQQPAPCVASPQPMYAPPAAPDQPVFIAPPPLAQAKRTTGGESQSGMKTCSQCGADNPGSAKLCWRCQEQLSPV